MFYLSNEFDIELAQSDLFSKFDKICTGAQELFENGNVSDGFTFLQAALELGQSTNETSLIKSACWSLCIKSFELDRFEECANFASIGLNESYSSFDELSATSFSVILADAEFYRGNLGLAKGAFQSILRDVEKLSENYAALVSLRLAQIKAHDSSDEERDWEQAVDRSFAAESPFWIAQSALGLSQLRRRQGKKSQILDGFKLAVSALDDLKPSRTHIEALFFAVEAMALVKNSKRWTEVAMHLVELCSSVSNGSAETAIVGHLGQCRSLMTSSVRLENDLHRIRRRTAYLKKLAPAYESMLHSLLSAIEGRCQDIR